MADVTITGLPNATVPLSGGERVPMDQNGTTVDASTQAIADLAAGTDLSYTQSSRTLASSTGGDVVLPLATDSLDGLMSAAHRALTAALAAAGVTVQGSAVVIPHIHGTIAGNFYIHVRNTSGAPLAAGTAVYVTGSVGDTDRLTVAACDPTDTAKMPAVGVLETTLANNGDGNAIILGELRPFNTAAFSLNQAMYVAAGGVLTGSVPTSGIVQAVGTVARVQSDTGTIVVHIGDRLGTAALRAVGTGAGTVAAGDDARFTDARTPTAHKSTHATGGSDALSPVDIGAEVAGAASSAVSTHVGQADPHTQYALEANLATVATSGSYADLSNKPSIPAPADAVPQAPGTAAVGTSTEYAREDHVHPLPGVATSSTAGLQPASGYDAIPYAAQVTLDFAALNGQMKTGSLTGDLELLSSNLANGREVRLRLVCDATGRTLTFPTDWKFVGTKPANIAASKVAILSLAAFGTTNADVVAAYAVQS